MENPVSIAPRTRARQRILTGIFLLALLAGVLLRRGAPEAERWTASGLTMGTHYRITIEGGQVPAVEQAELRTYIRQALEAINQTFSVYDGESELSQFNAWPPGKPMSVSPELHAVVALSLEVAGRSAGAFDPTIAPWVALWGFGPGASNGAAPEPEDLAAAEARIGYRHLRLHPGPALVKEVPGLALDLGGVAKGYGVDRLAALLEANGIEHALIEIGGDTRVLGAAAGGRPWRIGIQRPVYHEHANHGLMGVLHLRAGAVATSGNYRQFYHDAEERLRTHILDPRSGYPVEHALASVTVWAPTCAWADAWATALFVLGSQEGLSAAEREPDLEAFFLDHDDRGDFLAAMTSGFAETTGYRAESPDP